MISSYADYLNLNAFEWVIFALALILIAGLLFLVPISLGIARKKYPAQTEQSQEKSE